MTELLTLVAATVAVTIPITDLVLFSILATVTLALAIYLVVTNPPKEEGVFLGIGTEKYTDEELLERQSDNNGDY
jgi:hypothetical protein